jgi:hypothetical protein
MEVAHASGDVSGWDVGAYAVGGGAGESSFSGWDALS